MSNSISMGTNNNLKSINHPIHYTIFKPNILVKSDESQLKGGELKVYEEILNDNHKATPDKLTYRIHYDLVFDSKTNVTANRKRLSKSIQSKVVFLDKAFMKEYFNEDFDQGIALFPTVRYKSEFFEVDLHPIFKKILCMTDLGFTKGDILTLRTFKHDISHSFYYVARNRQTFKAVWKISIEDFKKELNITGYNDIRNFKKRIIEPIYEDMKGTWMEFEKDPYVRGGKGNKILGLEFRFIKGPKDEKDVPIGSYFGWEKTLKALKVGELVIKKMRQYVKAGSVTNGTDGVEIEWDSEYIYYSIEGATNEFKAKEKDKKRIKVKDKAAWFVHGVMSGQWLDYVNDKKKQLNKTIQTQLFENRSD